MSYSKKDEDADQAIFKVDRTSVFQEGKLPQLTLLTLQL
jgi:coatomer protein complex subunit gamma